MYRRDSDMVVAGSVGSRRAEREVTVGSMSEAKAASIANAPTWSKSVVRDYFESICIAVVFALFVRTFVVQAFKIPSSSMEDTLLIGDHILVNKFAYGAHPPWLAGILPYREVAPRDVIVFKYPRDAAKDYIKRIIAEGGDEVSVRGGQVIRNGIALEEPYTFIKAPFGDEANLEFWRRRHASENRGGQQIRPSEFYVMGDNRNNSEDSRFWGTVPRSYIRGKALLIYWSFEVPRHLQEGEAMGTASASEKAELWRYTAWHFFTKTRWSRTFRVVR